MRLVQIKHFVTVAQLGNFRRASRQLGISQPALTRSIQNLEHYFKVRLLDRLPREVILTEYGEAVYQWARETLSSSTSIKRYVDQLSSSSAGELVIGTGTYFADTVLATALGSLVERFPDLRMKIIRDSGQNAEALLLTRQIDLFLGWIAEPLKSDQITINSFSTGPIVFFCRSGHPLLGGGMDDWQAVLEYPLVTPTVPPHLKEEAGRFFSRYLDPGKGYTSIEFDSYSEVRKVVELSHCVGGLPLSSMGPYLDGRPFERLPVILPGVEGLASVSYLKGRTLLPATRILVDEVMLILDDRLGYRPLLSVH